MSQNAQVRLFIGLVTALVVACLCTLLPESEPPAPAPEAAVAADAPAANEAPAQPAPDEEKQRFVALVLEALSDHGAEGFEYDAEKFALVSKAEEGADTQRTMFLENFYAEYQAATPEARDAMLERHARLAAGLPEAPKSFALVEPDLLPVVRERVFFTLLELGREDARNAPVYRPFGEVMGVGLVWDQPDAIAYITERDLAGWGVTYEQAMESALRNLRRKGGKLVKDKNGVCVSIWHDNHDATRVLLPEVVRGCKVRGEPVVLMPNRNNLIVTGTREPKGLARAAELASGIIEEEPRAMGGWALRLVGDAYERFMPAPSSPVWGDYQRLVDDSLQRDYAKQKARLDELHEKSGKDVFVATRTRAEAKDGSRYVDYAVQSRGVESLLPRADVLVFVDVDEEGLRTGDGVKLKAAGNWEDVRRILGDRLQPVGMFPERYRVTSWPTEAELAEIGNVMGVPEQGSPEGTAATESP
ncbi:MAG TPA: hypothetical protein VK447_01925 [Myxococcaceae bacterium]|nr:hypothetical protein [Myxococcaceae bacterium]